MKRTQRILGASIVTVALAAAGYVAASATAISEITGGPARADDHGQVLYLTFDDGPGNATVDILDVLDEYDAKAVFFSLGTNLAHHTDLGRRIVAEGHVLANHTWNHDDLTALDAGERRRDLERTADLLHQLGSDSPCVRPPHGSTEKGMRDELTSYGMRQVLWNVDSEDWTDPNVADIVDRLLRAESGDVILMHDGGGDRTKTVEALRRALPKLAAEGYTFEAVPGC